MFYEKLCEGISIIFHLWFYLLWHHRKINDAGTVYINPFKLLDSHRLLLLLFSNTLTYSTENTFRKTPKEILMQ